MSRFGKTYEAREWLRANKNPGALGFNVLRTTANAIRLVEDLYAAGAQKVHVANINEHPGTIDEEGGPYADTLLVKPPPDNRNWREFITVLATLDADEVHLIGGKTGPFFRVWWD
jgi:hypothetical protein